MSDPKQVHIQGDVDISDGNDASLGTGFLYVTSTTGGLDVQGLTDLDQTNIVTDDGQFTVTGTNKVSITPTNSVEVLAGATSFFKSSVGTVTVQAIAGALNATGNSVAVVADTTTATFTGATGVTIASLANNVTVNASSNFDVNATAAVTIDANAASNFTVTGSGNLTLDTSAGRAILNGGAAASNAVTIAALNAAGGIDIDAGTGGFDVLVTDGAFSIDGQNAASNLSLATNANAQDLTISLTGTSDSSILILSSGTGADAIKLTASGTTSGIDIDAGTSGVLADTTGPISLGAAAASDFTVTGAFDLTLESTLGSVIIKGGEAAVDAIQLTTTDVAGGIDINAGTGGITVDTTAGFSVDGATASNITLTGTAQLIVNNTAGQLQLQSGQAAVDAVRIYASNGAGGVDMDSGTGGTTIDSQGLISIDAVGASSNFSLNTSGNGQNLTIALTGTSDSTLFLTSTGTSATDAIVINASAGGINMDSTGTVAIDTTDITNGVTIATATNGVPVTIGTATSTTTISGSLIVSGTTTTVNTETLLVEDNLLVLSSGGGELGADGGMVIRRYQTPNNAGPGGDVMGDTGTGVISGAFGAAGTLSPDTLTLDPGASAANSFYNGWWIKITSGTQTGKIRRIKSYVGATQVATLYMTADNVTGFTDGLDLGGTASLTGDTYNVYNSPYVASFYDESADKWVLAFTNIVPDAIPVSGPSTVTIQRYTAFDCGAIFIQTNGDPSTSTLNVNYINEATSDIGVTIEGVNINNGLIGGSAPDTSEIVLLPDNAQTLVNVTATSTIGSYMIFADAVQSASGAGSFLRQAGGAFAVFAVASSGIGGAINRLAGSKGSANQRLDCDWNVGGLVQLQHRPAFTGGTGLSKPYRVKTQRVV
jgi:hypothetical protein